MRIILTYILLSFALLLNAQPFSSLYGEYLSIKSSKKRVEFVNDALHRLPDQSNFLIKDSVLLNEIDLLFSVLKKKDMKKVDEDLRLKYENLRTLVNDMVASDYLTSKLMSLSLFFDESDTSYIKYVLSEYDNMSRVSKILLDDDVLEQIRHVKEYVQCLSKYSKFISEVRTFDLLTYEDLARHEQLSFQYSGIAVEDMKYLPYDVRKKILLNDAIYAELMEMKSGLLSLPHYHHLLSSDSGTVQGLLDRYDSLSNLMKTILADSIRTKIQKYAEVSKVITEIEQWKISISDCDSVSHEQCIADSILFEVLKKYPIALYFKNQKVIYGPRSSELTVLLKYIRVLKNNPNARLAIFAFGVNCGKFDESSRIVYERAMSVRALLGLYGANLDQVEVNCKLLHLSKLFEEDAELLHQYRRVEFSVHCEIE